MNETFPDRISDVCFRLYIDTNNNCRQLNSMNRKREALNSSQRFVHLSQTFREIHRTCIYSCGVNV